MQLVASMNRVNRTNPAGQDRRRLKPSTVVALGVAAILLIASIPPLLIVANASVREKRLAFVEAEILKGNYYGWQQASFWESELRLLPPESARLQAAKERCRVHPGFLSSRPPRWRPEPPGSLERWWGGRLKPLADAMSGGLPYRYSFFGPAFYEMPLAK